MMITKTITMTATMITKEFCGSRPWASSGEQFITFILCFGSVNSVGHDVELRADHARDLDEFSVPDRPAIFETRRRSVAGAALYVGDFADAVLWNRSDDGRGGASQAANSPLTREIGRA